VIASLPSGNALQQQAHINKQSVAIGPSDKMLRRNIVFFTQRKIA